MDKVTYTRDDQVAVITMADGENRFNPGFLQEFLETLDAVETEADARALVVTSAHEKIFSNGIDLEWLVPVIQKGDIGSAKDFFRHLNLLFERTLMSPLLTVAAINGHAFAGGAIWACAFDFRFMRTDRGFFCFPEVDLGIPFLPGMLGLLGKAIPSQVMDEMIFTGRRLTAEECAARRIVNKAVPADHLLEEAMAFARTLHKNRAFVSEMKNRMYGEIVRAFHEADTPYIESGSYHIG